MRGRCYQSGGRGAKSKKLYESLLNEPEKGPCALHVAEVGGQTRTFRLQDCGVWGQSKIGLHAYTLRGRVPLRAVGSSGNSAGRLFIFKNFVVRS